MKWPVVATVMAYNIFLIAGTAWLVGWHGWSGWWFALTIIMLLGVRDKGDDE